MTMVLPTFAKTKVGRAEGYSLNTNFRCKTPSKTNLLYYVNFQEWYKPLETEVAASVFYFTANVPK
ncbi:hypothetical protein C9E89_014925 [Acinetobacter sichuanensis]|uniref:Uncharacterized protein n=1 Tax=Acinetobacter sichuanensis TaxID=2136183 RepID=A0A371YMW7_9GAMM|nr:hypothetical protein C9E89_014925 [Acinetobacter sichuanensis]